MAALTSRLSKEPHLQVHSRSFNVSSLLMCELKKHFGVMVISFVQQAKHQQIQ